MLYITKEKGVVTLNTPLEEWLGYYGGALPDDVVVAIGDNHVLFERVTSAGAFDVVIENGELVDIIELPPEVIEISAVEQIESIRHNIRTTDDFILRKLETILNDFSSNLPEDERKEVEFILNERQKGWAVIDELEGQL